MARVALIPYLTGPISDTRLNGRTLTRRTMVYRFTVGKFSRAIEASTEHEAAREFVAVMRRENSELFWQLARQKDRFTRLIKVEGPDVNETFNLVGLSHNLQTLAYRKSGTS